MSAGMSLQRVLNEGLDAYRHTHQLSERQWQVCHHVQSCRTPALGALELQCDTCDNRPIVYHACRDRHCPRCQRQATEDWCARQQAQVLAVTYHHLVFTLSDGLNDWIGLQPRCLYALLFESVWATLEAFGRDPRRLDGQMGATAVLHTWGQTLVRHVHLHVLCPGGAFGKDGSWHAAKSTYLFPVRALSRYFRGAFVSRLRRAVEKGECPEFGDKAAVKHKLDELMATDWVVYSKPVVTDTQVLIGYLGRYTHRIALSDSRLEPGNNGRIALAYKDYRDNRHKVMDLEPQELIRRYLLHVLPRGFMRVRHYGFLANRCRKDKLPRIRAAIAEADAAAAAMADKDGQDGAQPRQGQEVRQAGYPCKRCHRGRLRVIAVIAPQRDDGG